MFNLKRVLVMLFLVFGIYGLLPSLNVQAETATPNITIANFKYSNVNNDQNVSTQIEFDLVNAANSSATFNLSSWDDTTNFPLKSGLYTLAANQTTHVYLMDVNNISHLAVGPNSINVKIVSTDSTTVYNSQDFTVIRGNSSREVATPNITIANFKYSNVNNDQNVSTQIELDLVNAANSSATFNLSSWDDTTNFPLKSGLYTLAANQTTHVYLMDVNNISHLAVGPNSINVKIVSTDSTTVYNSQDFTVIRGGDASINTISTHTDDGSNGNSSDTFVSVNPASSLGDDKIGQLLAEINSLKNTIAEQANQIKYLNNLVKGTNISTDAQSTLNNFITYGSDANTKKLGAGERASVIYSYKNAFDKLPTTQAELSDVIKIANGRWPSATSTDAESQAKIQFKKIYQKKANMSNANDNAAITVMAYGLKQKAENRNLDSEANGIKTFKAIYGHTPNTTEEWNIMQAITYSGASR